MNKKVMLFSRDPGGANTVAPLYTKLIDKGYDVKLFGKDAALKKYIQYGLSGINITDKVKVSSVEEIEKFLIEESPDFLITGTSADDYTEKYLWKACEKIGIKNFAILDQWVNYGVRFSKFSIDELNEYEKSKEHEYLPYKILVMDEYAKEQMILTGIEDIKLLVSGQPYFDYLIDIQENFNEKNIIDFKNNMGTDGGDVVITFASEPISMTYKETDISEHYWGYTERTIFKQFIKVLNNIAENNKIKIKLIIRLHPKEDENNYKDILDSISSKYISITVDKKLNGFELICASDLICGMSSMFLIEAAIIGKPIMSMQMGLKRENSFILHKKAIIKSILSEEKLEYELKKILLEKKIEGCNFKVEKGVVDKVINFMEEILCQC